MEGENQNKKPNFEVGDEKAINTAVETLPSTEFVKVEKNLASLGFFTPSSKRTRDEKSKTVSVTIVLDGKRIEAKATIAPTALFGLPITADQDKWLALHKILTDLQTRDGQVTNPVSFTSAELLALLKIYKNSGKNYKDVSDWLDVMVGTTIISEGAVYAGGKRAFGKDTFHVFDRAVSFGKELPDGSIADKNYVWLSQWQLQNINDHHQLPIDLDSYRQLKNHVSKALVPLLQIWLYATRDDGVFEKSYDELCQILNVRRWGYLSKIKEKLGPSLDELKQFGYLADWQIQKMSDNQSYKIVFYHGEKFHRDRHARQNRKQTLMGEGMTNDRANGTSPPRARHNQNAQHQDFAKPDQAAQRPMFDPQLVAKFTSRNITEKKAAEILANLKPGQDVVAQLELGDQLIRHSRVPIVNPPGFYIHLIKADTPVPEKFETTARREAREEREREEKERREAEEARQLLEWDYDDYCQQETERYIEENPAPFEAIKEAKLAEQRGQHPTFSLDMLTTFAIHEAKREVRKQLPLPTFEEFAAHKKEPTLPSSKPIPDAALDAIRDPEATTSTSETPVIGSDTPTTDPKPAESPRNLFAPVAELASAEILPDAVPEDPSIALAAPGSVQPPLIISTDPRPSPEAAGETGSWVAQPEALKPSRPAEPVFNPPQPSAGESDQNP